MIAMPASEFCRASDLPASPSREAQLEELVRTQATAIERLEGMLDGPQQATGGKLSGQEKAAIIAAMSKLDDRLKDVERATKGLDDLKREVQEAGQKVYDVHELALHNIQSLAKRCSALEQRGQPQETPRNQQHLSTIWAELLRRQQAGRVGITYTEAAKLCRVDKSVIKKLRGLISADARFDIIWHPKRKNTKLICLKNYK